MSSTRTTLLIAAAMAVALVAAAAGMGAYIAVRQNASTPDAAGELPASEGRMAAAVHGIAPRAVADRPDPAPGVAVETTEQIVEPPAEGVSVGADPPNLEASRTPRSSAPAPRQAPARPRRATVAPAAAPSPPAAPRAETQPPAPRAIERQRPRAARRPAPAVEQPEPEPNPPSEIERAEPAERRRPARASRDVPEVDGWMRAEHVPPRAGRDAPSRDDVTPPVRPRPAPASLDPPADRADADPPPPATEELVIPADSVIGLQIDTFVTTDRAEVEDDVQARVTRDVMVSRRVAIPAGSLVNGSVVMVERGGKLQGTARLGVRFHTVVLDDGVEVPIVTETVYREGRSRGRDNAARIGGGAVAGAILGAIFGGGRGAAIGGAAGAAGGTAAAAAGDAEPATLPAGTTLTVRLSRPGSVTVER